MKIGNQEKVIKYTVSNIKKFKGVPMEQMQNGDVTAMVKHTSELLHVGLLFSEKDITIDEVDILIDTYIEDGGTLPGLMEVLTHEYIKALGIKTDDVAPNAAKKK